MIFSDRVERVCRSYNEVLADKAASKNAGYQDYAAGELAAYNDALATLGIPCVRTAGGYITGFEIMGYIHEVRS